MKKSELRQLIREEIQKVLNEFKSFNDLETAIKYHEKGEPMYDETKLKNIFNQLNSNDQVKARKNYSKYFGIREEISKIKTQRNIIKENDIFNDTYTVSDEVYDRMDALTNQKDLLVFLNSASKIMKNLTDNGFEVKDVFYYLYTRLTADV